MKLIYSFLTFCAFVLCFSSCQKNANTVEYVYETPIVFEGEYLFQGPNTTNVTHQNTRISLGEGQNLEDISSVSIKSVTLTASEGENFDIMDNISIHFLHDDIEMTKVAIVSPIEKGKSTLTLTVAEGADDLSDFFKREDFSVVVDANFNKAPTKPIRFDASIKFELVF